MVVLPFPPIIDSDILERNFTMPLHQWHHQHHWAPCRIDMTAVSKTLFYKMLMFLQNKFIKRKESTKILEARKIVGFNQPNFHSRKIEKFVPQCFPRTSSLRGRRIH